MTIQHISAVTLAVKHMSLSVDFYRKIGLQLVYGGKDSGFTSFRAGDGFINLAKTAGRAEGWWGRVILRVEGVDSFYSQLVQKGMDPEMKPRDGGWGERYFHIRDPDGHELSFAQLLNSRKT